MRRALVTGAAGFLGRHFSDALRAEGVSVYMVDDFSSPYAQWPTSGGHTIDVLDWLKGHGYESFDVIYHFAAPVGGRVKIEQDPLFNARSLEIDSALFRWAIGRAGLVVYPSSSAVYGTGYQRYSGMPLLEGLFMPQAGSWQAPDEMYGFTKLVGETLAWKAEAYGLNTLAIRPFSGYGEGQSMEYPVPSICARALRREDPILVWGSGQQKRDFIHVDDIVAATFARIEAGVVGYQAMNIGSGQPTSFVDIAHEAAMLVGYEPRITFDPDKPQGVDTRYCDPGLMLKYHTPRVSLRNGLARVIESLEGTDGRVQA